MARRYSVFLIALVVLFCIGPLQTSASTTACEDPDQWFSVFLPPEVLNLVCSIVEGLDPVGLVADGGGQPAEMNWETEVDPTIQETNLPEPTKQELILWLLFWTQP